MTSLGSLVAFMPTSGSFATYGARYVEPGFGFALGWKLLVQLGGYRGPGCRATGDDLLVS